MPNAATTPAAEAQAATQPEQQAPAQEPDWKAEYDKLKVQARKWEDRAKSNYEARQRLDEIEEASKTEAQKQADALAKAQAKLAAAEARASILEVAAAKGIPADLLTGPGDDPEGYADRLAAYIADKTPAAPAAGHHINSAATPERPAMITIDEQIAAAEKAGDRAAAMRLKAVKLGTKKQ